MIRETQKQTAFSQLIKNEVKRRKIDDGPTMGTDLSEKLQRQILFKRVSIKEFLDGPAYSLPPIKKLAEQFVDACLRQRR